MKMKKTRFSARIQSKEKLLAGIALGIGLSATTASAAVEIVPVNLSLSNGAFVSLDPSGNTFVEGYNASVDIQVGNCSGNLSAYSNTSDIEWLGTLGAIQQLSVGELIDGADSFFSSFPVSLNNPAAAGETVYFGYRQINQGALGDETYYGYLAIIEADGSVAKTFANYAFNDASGQGITVVPEPSTTGILFGMAGLAVVGLRRKRC